MITNKNLLFVSLLYAPNAIVGAKRIIFLKRYLMNHGFNPYVLTLKARYCQNRDDSLSDEQNVLRVSMIPRFPIDSNNKLKKSMSRLWTRYLAMIDPYMGFILFAVLKGAKIIYQNKIDVIIASFPTASNLVVAFILKVLTKSKLIFDYRDPWTTLKTRPFSNPVVRRFNNLLELFFIKKVDRFVFCTSMMREMFLTKFGSHYLSRTCVITNGFEDNGIVPITFQNNKINILYAGNFYGKQRKFETLAKPLSNLKKQNLISDEQICLHIFGQLNKTDLQLIDDCRINDLIHYQGLISYSRVRQYIKGADILILLSGSDVRYALPFKIFDYIAAKKPILAIAPLHSSVADFMNENELGELANIADLDDIATKLMKIVSNNNTYNRLDRSAYSWKAVSRHYSELIKTLI